MSTSKTALRWITLAGLALAATLLIAGLMMSNSAVAAPRGQTSVNHSLFPQLAGPFEKPQDVTAACLTCHADAAKQVMGTIHWTWEYTDPLTGQVVGKKNVINNYCVAVPSNEPRCTSCHIGYGWKDNTFDFNAETNVDCLVCHDTSGAYKKFPPGAGNPVLGEAKEFPAGSGKMWEPVDLAAAAQAVGAPTRANCGSCHFFGGGGDAVKHGDLDKTMTNPTRELDVHMGTDGGDFTCEACHQPEGHSIPGRIYNGEARVMCEDCHNGDSAPHQGSALGDALSNHTDVLACQTCHIPAFARGEATKMSWDWSTAGLKNEEGKPLVTKNEAGEVIYDGQKGDFTWEANVIPYYMWWNGNTYFLTVNDQIDPTQVVQINAFEGSRKDGKIYPFKRFTGKQGYDTVYSVLLIPNLFPNNADDTSAYWKGYDWNAAFNSGMASVNASYSGEFDWVSTEMFWVQNHQVAPREDAVQCQECHTAENGRLDFAALGYSDAELAGLTTFPPSLGQAPAEQPTEMAAVKPPAESAAEVVEPAAAAESTNLGLWFGIVAALVIGGVVLVVSRRNK